MVCLQSLLFLKGGNVCLLRSKRVGRDANEIDIVDRGDEIGRYLKDVKELGQLGAVSFLSTKTNLRFFLLRSILRLWRAEKFCWEIANNRVELRQEGRKKQKRE